MYEIFEQLLSKYGVTAYKVAKETGITTATLSNWKQGKYTPKQDKLQKIADYFGVSLEYLMTGKEEVVKEKAPELTARDERDIKKDLDSLREKLANKESGPAAYDGQDIPEEEKRIAYMVVTADKGLAGSYNHNILKIAEEELAKHPKRQLYVLGEVGRHYFEERGIEINKQFHYTIQNPTLNRARNISEELLEGYRQGDFDEIYIIYTSMVNAMQEEAEMLQLLPLKKADFHNVEIPLDVRREELALRPSADAVMNRIVPDYVVGFVYGALVESFSCEQNARMMAMEAATNSAKDMLHELDIMYNRARQAAITQEITEVIAGAKSQKRKKKR